LQKNWGGPFRSENFVVPEIAVCCSDVRRKHIDSFTKTMLKTATDSILLLALARWNGSNVITYPGGTQLTLRCFLLEVFDQKVDQRLRPRIIIALDLCADVPDFTVRQHNRADR
jgi:hypothetical protein